MLLNESVLDAAAQAIRSGHVDVLTRLLREHPDLAAARIGPRTLLHVATDWPGHFPHAPEAVAALIQAGADVNAPFEGFHSETPLHWAASSDDVAVLDALLDRGADVDAPGGVIGGGTPLADAVAFGQWQAARRLIERGAKATFSEAAALGLRDRLEAQLTDSPPAPEEITNAFWCACHGGQRDAAEYLLNRGADLNWIGHDNLTPLDVARQSRADELVQWLRAQGARSADEQR